MARRTRSVSLVDLPKKQANLISEYQKLGYRITARDKGTGIILVEYKDNKNQVKIQVFENGTSSVCRSTGHKYSIIENRMNARIQSLPPRRRRRSVRKKQTRRTRRR